MTKYVTFHKIMSFDPCYDRKEILGLLGGVKKMTVYEFCDLRRVCAEDKLWLLLRTYYIPEPQLILLACHWAEEYLRHREEEGLRILTKWRRAIAIRRKTARDDEVSMALIDMRNEIRFTDSTPAAIRNILMWNGEYAVRDVGNNLSSRTLAITGRDKEAHKMANAQLRCVRVMLKWLDEKRKQK
jgi:hypothetical protein